MSVAKRVIVTSLLSAFIAAAAAAVDHTWCGPVPMYGAFHKFDGLTMGGYQFGVTRHGWMRLWGSRPWIFDLNYVRVELGPAGDVRANRCLVWSVAAIMIGCLAGMTRSDRSDNTPQELS